MRADVRARGAKPTRPAARGRRGRHDVPLRRHHAHFMRPHRSAAPPRHPEPSVARHPPSWRACLRNLEHRQRFFWERSWRADGRPRILADTHPPNHEPEKHIINPDRRQRLPALTRAPPSGRLNQVETTSRKRRPTLRTDHRCLSAPADDQRYELACAAFSATSKTWKTAPARRHPLRPSGCTWANRRLRYAGSHRTGTPRRKTGEPCRSTQPRGSIPRMAALPGTGQRAYRVLPARSSTTTRYAFSRPVRRSQSELISRRE